MNEKDIINYVKKCISFVTGKNEEQFKEDKLLREYEIDFFDWQEIVIKISDKYDIMPEKIEKADSIDEIANIVLNNENKIYEENDIEKIIRI